MAFKKGVSPTGYMYGHGRHGPSSSRAAHLKLLIIPVSYVRPRRAESPPEGHSHTLAL